MAGPGFATPAGHLSLITALTPAIFLCAGRCGGSQHKCCNGLLLAMAKSVLTAVTRAKLVQQAIN
jgi:hypothetical protein